MSEAARCDAGLDAVDDTALEAETARLRDVRRELVVLMESADPRAHAEAAAAREPDRPGHWWFTRDWWSTLADADDVRKLAAAALTVLRAAELTQTAPEYGRLAELALHYVQFGHMPQAQAAVSMLAACRDLVDDAVADALAGHWMTAADYLAALPGERARWHRWTAATLDYLNEDLAAAGLQPFASLTAKPLIDQVGPCGFLSLLIRVDEAVLCAMCAADCDGPASPGGAAKMIWPALFQTPALHPDS
jgi:hypothetical protein